jgi:galactokinase
MTQDNRKALREKFIRRFGQSPRLYQAPGRVNLIGEHTDYNDGFVLPAAIGFCTHAAIATRTDRKIVVHSENFKDTAEFDLDYLPAVRRGQWSDYIVGVAKILLESGHKLTGANVLLEGDVPQGAGLSSSASVEVVFGYALLAPAGQVIDRKELALLCQRAENEFVGARCGIMDQFVSCHGKTACALLLDCRSLDFRFVPLPKNIRLVICNTLVKHSVAHGEYNRRREECELGVKLLSKHLPGIRALRDVSSDDLRAHVHELPEPIQRRCRHVVTENARVIEAAHALECHDLATFGRLMKQSHDSLRDDFEVSCRELDCMVELSANIEGVYGSRMTGGGFGGCTVSLVRADCVADFTQVVGEGYERAMGRRPEIHKCEAANGAGEIVDD